MLAEVFVYFRNHIEKSRYCHTCLNGIRTLGDLHNLQVALEDWTLQDEYFADQQKYYEEWVELKGLAEETIRFCILCKMSFSPGLKTVMKRGARMLVPCMEIEGIMYVRSPSGFPGMQLDANGMPDWNQLRRTKSESDWEMIQPFEDPERDDEE